MEGMRGMKVLTGVGTNIELLRVWPPAVFLVLRAVTGDCDAERNAWDALPWARGDVLGTVAVGVGTNMCAGPVLTGGAATGVTGGTTGAALGMNTRGVV